MANLSELRNEIARIVKQSTNGLLSTEIDQAINDAIRFHSLRRFEFNDGFAAITTSDGVVAYDLPPDFLGMTHAQLFWGGSQYSDLRSVSWDWFLAAQRNGDLRATPSTHFALRAGQIHLHPTPASTFTGHIYYVKQLTPFPMSQDDDTSEWTTEARLLIRSRALYDLYLTRIQQADYAATAKALEDDELERLSRPNVYNLGRQTIRPYVW